MQQLFHAYFSYFSIFSFHGEIEKECPDITHSGVNAFMHCQLFNSYSWTIKFSKLLEEIICCRRSLLTPVCGLWAVIQIISVKLFCGVESFFLLLLRCKVSNNSRCTIKVLQMVFLFQFVICRYFDSASVVNFLLIPTNALLFFLNVW